MLWLLDVALRRLMSMSGSRERRLRFCLQCHIADVRKDPINLRDYSPERSAAQRRFHDVSCTMTAKIDIRATEPFTQGSRGVK